jgi:hypothetical protein
MSVVTVKGHYDGQHVCLDAPVDLPVNTPVWVILPQPGAQDPEREEWLAFARAAFARAYGPDEPDHSDAPILERPPE